MISNAQKSLNIFSRDFIKVVEATNRFYKYASEELDKRDSNIELEEELPAKRIKRKNKWMEKLVQTIQ